MTGAIALVRPLFLMRATPPTTKRIVIALHPLQPALSRQVDVSQ